MWNFNHPKGWERFNKFTGSNNSLSDCWNDISDVETSCEKWSDYILKVYFSKQRIKSQNKYDSRIGQLISKQKEEIEKKSISS